MQEKWILDRIKAIVERWDKAKYTDESQPMRGLIAELKEIVDENEE